MKASGSGRVHSYRHPKGTRKELFKLPSPKNGAAVGGPPSQCGFYRRLHKSHSQSSASVMVERFRARELGGWRLRTEPSAPQLHDCKPIHVLKNIKRPSHLTPHPPGLLPGLTRKRGVNLEFCRLHRLPGSVGRALPSQPLSAAPHQTPAGDGLEEPQREQHKHASSARGGGALLPLRPCPSWQHVTECAYE